LLFARLIAACDKETVSGRTHVTLQKTPRPPLTTAGFADTDTPREKAKLKPTWFRAIPEEEDEEDPDAPEGSSIIPPITGL
jgi:hypothetical protein